MKKLLMLVVLMLAGCVSGGSGDGKCERCHSTYSYNGAGERSTTSHSCSEIACASASCDTCYNMSYDLFGELVSQTCDSCENSQGGDGGSSSCEIPAGKIKCNTSMNCKVGEICKSVKCPSGATIQYCDSYK
jgi:hypothetical protein